jgi:5-deoxy-D-glucuronate isomerase
MKTISYPWMNKNRLETLKVSGKENIVLFETDIEKVEVYIEDGDISKIVHITKDLETIIKKNQRHHIVVGEGNTQRDVYHYLKPAGPSPFLRLGITIHQGLGTWSSLPHKFELQAEPGFEEVFFYLLDGTSKRAIQVGKGVWCDGSAVDEIWLVKDRSFSTIPMGYHPIVGEPGVKVSYLWAYLAKKKEWEKI